MKLSYSVRAYHQRRRNLRLLKNPLEDENNCLFVVRKMVLWWMVRALKLGIVLMVTLTAYSLMKAIIRYSDNFTTVYEVEPTEMPEVLLGSPFVKDQPKLVVLLSYQRSGSSFVGEWFNTNPTVFYNFEPVDSLYSAMYGTPQDSNAPSDITNYPNGSIRILPSEELSAVSSFLKQFLLCDIASLPTQSLLTFYSLVTTNLTTSLAYQQCIRREFLPSYRSCEPYLNNLCGTRFGVVSEAMQKECFKRLWLKPEDPRASSNEITGVMFRQQKICVDALREHLKVRCQHLLLESCQSRSFRVMKTVRTTMESMEPLLETLPNFRVIHLVRDPRAVALSRERFQGNVRGIFSGSDMNTLLKEAKLICSTVVRDIKERLRLEQKYPGRIIALNFDEIVRNKTLHLENVYRFLDEKPRVETMKWLSTAGRTNRLKKTSEDIVNKWQDLLTFNENKQIVETCREFYDLVKFNWAM